MQIVHKSSTDLETTFVTLQHYSHEQLSHYIEEVWRQIAALADAYEDTEPIATLTIYFHV